MMAGTAQGADFPVFQMDDLIAEVIRFRPADLLIACRSSALAIAQNGPMINVEVPSSITGRDRRTAIKVMAYSPALIARISILKGSSLAIGTLNENAFLRLLWMVAMLWEGTTDFEELRLRATYEQWWSQENLGRSIGRAVLFYQDIPGMLESPAFDVRGEAEQALGLNIEDYVGTAFQLFALAMSPEQTPFFYPTTIRSTVGTQWAKGLLSAENVKIFLGTFAASVERFKELAADGDHVLERYAFNPLFQAPLIEVSGSGCIAPIPDLLIWRVEDAPYWELRNKFHGEGRSNQFATFFGKEIFERYVGLQLAAYFGEGDVLVEQAYNGKLGPDWIVKIGAFGLAVECTIGSLAIAARSGFDLDALRTGLEERYVARLNALPQKVKELTAARPDLELEGVKEWHYALVYRDPIGPPAKEIIADLIDREVGLYHLLSTEELEDFVNVGKEVGLQKLLLEKESATDLQQQDFREFLRDVAARESLNFSNSLVAAATHRIFDKLGIPD